MVERHSVQVQSYAKLNNVDSKRVFANRLRFIATYCMLSISQSNGIKTHRINTSIKTANVSTQTQQYYSIIKFCGEKERKRERDTHTHTHSSSIADGMKKHFDVWCAPSSQDGIKEGIIAQNQQNWIINPIFRHCWWNVFSLLSNTHTHT